MLDMASHYQLVLPVADKNPLTVFYGFLLGWCLTLGVPECLRFDLGGEFESSFSELAEQIGCRLLPAVLEKDLSVDPIYLARVHRGSYYLTSGKNCWKIKMKKRRKVKLMKRSRKSERTLNSCMRHGDDHGME